MADAQNLPANLRFFMSRLQGVSTSHYKIYSTAGDTGSANKIIRFELPSNVLINLKSARLMFNAVATGAAGSIARLPDDTRSLVERMTIYAGGVQIQNGHNAYNVLAHAKKCLTGMEPASALTHPDFCRVTSYHTGAAAGDSETYDTPDQQLAIDSFDGFLGTAAPSIIDTGIFPQITVEFTLADNNVCTSSAANLLSGSVAATADAATAPAAVNSFTTVGNVAPSYTLSNMTMQIEVLGMASSILDEIIAERIGQVGYLSIPFKNYYTFSSQHTGTTRFNVNSSSFDRLWCCWRHNGEYSVSPSAPVVVAGYKVAGALTFGHPVATQVAGAGATTNIAYQPVVTAAANDIGKPQYDSGGVMGTNSEKYQSPPFRFQQVLAAGATGATYQLQINGSNYPSYRLNTCESLQLSLNSVDYFVNSNRKMTLDQFKKNYHVQCYRFCLPESDSYRLASGLDTRATSAQCAVLTEGLHASNQHLTIFAETSAELRVASRQVEVVP